MPTIQGDVHVLKRETGAPVLPITEQSASQGANEGDYTAATQPNSALTFRLPTMRKTDMWGTTPISQMICRIRFNSLRYERQYTALSEQGAIVYPGNFGVFNWGSIAAGHTLPADTEVGLVSLMQLRSAGF